MLFLVGLAWGQDVRAWQGLYEGMLIESAEGDLDGAIGWYEGLITGIPDDDPSLGELNFWLGRARYAEGDAEGARKALRIAMDAPDVEDRARALLAQIDSEELRVRRLPMTYKFSSGTGHWLHSWKHGDKGYLASEVPPSSEDPALAWHTNVVDRETDAIGLWFDDRAPRPDAIEMDLRSGDFAATLRLIVEDDAGQRWEYAEIRTSTSAWVRVEAPLSEFIPLDAGSGSHPRSVRALSLWDVTAYTRPDRGENVIYMDNLQIR
ncbi:MAG: tetratricopeptide repeat protein [Proteobacteria bacterium]|nr:tetratricopeptide repeat protein [Pseudomonadota bacterium]MCP4920320.1 tetratricopeptide repeat protein [Pseudomonadota bacterium]